MYDPEEMAKIVQPYATVSDRIRALHASGHSRVEIAEFLNKRYQHVRNVLVEDERRGVRPRGTAEPNTGVRETPAPPWSAAAFPTVGADDTMLLRLKVGEDGAIRIPPSLEEKLGYRRGGVVIAELFADRLMLWSASGALRRAQDLVRDLIPGRDSLAASLIADRRREAQAEDTT